MPDDALLPPEKKVLVVHERLCGVFGCPVRYFRNADPLSELVSALLNHQTRDADASAAYKALREGFSTWEAVRDAPTDEVQALIGQTRWPEQKAPRVQAVLKDITRRHGELSLDFLATMPTKEARAWLEELNGVGPKTSAAVMAFSSLRRRALPVDSHHHRVAQRLALIGPKVEEGPSHKILEGMLPEEWDAQTVYDNHECLMFHGRQVCLYKNPQCQKCVLLDLCPTGQARLSADKELAPGR